MKNTENDQRALAMEFHISEMKTIKLNYEASLKIKRWRLIQRIPASALYSRKQADMMIKDALLLYIKSSALLLMEGYNIRSLNN